MPSHVPPASPERTPPDGPASISADARADIGADINSGACVDAGPDTGADTCEVHGLHPEKLERVRAAAPGPEAFSGLADIFKALADPTRARILHALSVEELCVCDLAALTELSASAVSHQLRLLRASRLVRFRRQGKMAFYSLDDDHVRRLLAEGLDHALERDARRGGGHGR